MIPEKIENLRKDAVRQCGQGCPNWHQIDLMIQELSEERIYLIATCEKQKETIASMRAALNVAKKIITRDREVLWENLQRDAENLRLLATGQSTPFGPQDDEPAAPSLDEECKLVGAASTAARHEVAESRMWMIACATIKQGLAIWRSTARRVLAFNDQHPLARSRRRGPFFINGSGVVRSAIPHKSLVISGIIVAVLMGVIAGLLLNDLLPG